ncbi:translocation/assembly module TamB domain-containing protein [Asaia bogorensis]|uniref:translocation/assembly module TamB domain-containing protein n=1 Tax=Asaia bogorensis TaxID=91915 RepID=UPI001F122063|nr:translocation/assembly module TamB domain-containing protein [Asaia bogorensis]
MLKFPRRRSPRQSGVQSHGDMLADAPGPRVSRLRRIALWSVSLLVGVPLTLIIVALAAVLVFVNIPYGQRVIERQTASLIGGMVELEGVGGFIPSRLHIRRITLHDHLGPYLTVDEARLNWSPLSLVHMTVRASLLQAESLRFERLPVSDPSAPPAAPSSGEPSSLHLGIALAKLDLHRLDLGKSLAGFPLSASAQGHLTLADLVPVLDGLKIGKLPKTDLGLDIRRLDRPATIALKLATPRDTINLHLDVQDGVHGLVAQAAKLDELEPLTLALDLKGPVQANDLRLTMRAGAVQADAQGHLDLTRHLGTLGVSASTPAMTPFAGVAWSGMTLKANLRGDLLAPSGDGALDIDALAAAGAGVNHLTLRFAGDEGHGPRAAKIRLDARADGVRAPGVPGGLLAQAPIEAVLQAEPEKPAQPFLLSITHPLFRLGTTGVLKPDITGALDLVLPDLKPLAAIGKTDLAGHNVAHLDYTYRPGGESRIVLRDRLAITGGMKQLVALLGEETSVNLDATMTPAPNGERQVRIGALTVDGHALHLRDEGSILLGTHSSIVNDLALALPDLKAAAPQIRGHVTVAAHSEGPFDDLAARLKLEGEIGTGDVPSGPLTLDLALTHLPATPEGTLQADGKLDGRKLAINAGFAMQKSGEAYIDLKTLDWANLSGRGKLTLPAGAKFPLGTLAITAGNLADFSALAGRKLGGKLLLDLKTSDPAPQAPPVMTLSLKGAVQADPARIGTLDLSGTVRDPVSKPDMNLRLALGNVVFQDMKGNASLSARGPLEALALGLTGRFEQVLGAPATLDTALLLDLPGKTIRLDRLSALLKGEALRSAGVSTISFGEKTGVDRLQIAVAPPGVAPASLDLSGTIKPRLDVHLRVARVTPALAKPFMPTLDASGTLAAQADLGGDLTHPTGTVAVTLSGLHMRSGPAESLPALNLNANATLAGQRAQITMQADAGRRVGLHVAGSVPTSGTGNLDLKANGAIDLAVANAVLGAQGMALSGKTAIDLALGGGMNAPSVNGRVTLQGINFAHYGQGVRLTDINGTVVAANDTLSLQDVLAHAGKGTIALSGSVGVLRPGLPLDIRVIARKAQPITSDLLTAVIDTDVRAHGQLSTRLDVDGAIRLPSVIVNIPNSMPASVPQLTVIRPGDKRETATQAMIIGLDLNVISPGSFFVRGHGLDAEMSGKLHVGGVSTAPDISGGFDLKRGFFNLAGVNLNFTKGRVAFDGSGVDHKLDPSLDFRADRNVQGTVASLVVGGYASAPKIDFTSQPSLPRDQVLAMLLFGSSTASLSPTQLASLAAAVAQITGGSSFDPLDKVRGFLGLDRLAVGGGSGVNNGGASLEAGKYVMKGVYVGAKQATSGSGTQAQVQVDLTKRLKLNTTVGTGGQITGFTTPENDPGSSVGLSYGFDY